VDNTVELSDRQIRVLGLACVCPLGEQLSGCCMGELREKPLRDRVTLVRNMSNGELDIILTQHKTCLTERERR
jgi:hypothetical protein